MIRVIPVELSSTRPRGSMNAGRRSYADARATKRKRRRRRAVPSVREEAALREEGYSLVAGLDEVGEPAHPLCEVTETTRNDPRVVMRYFHEVFAELPPTVLTRIAAW